MRSLSTIAPRSKSRRRRSSDHRIEHKFCSCGCAIIQVRACGGKHLGYRDAASHKQISNCPGCNNKIYAFELLDYEPRQLVWPCPYCNRPLPDFRDMEDARRYGGCNGCGDWTGEKALVAA